MSRIIIFTGKGGVGKSSVAAAHALKSAESGSGNTSDKPHKVNIDF